MDQDQEDSIVEYIQTRMHINHKENLRHQDYILECSVNRNIKGTHIEHWRTTELEQERMEEYGDIQEQRIHMHKI